jgi:hypothetical protein
MIGYSGSSERCIMEALNWHSTTLKRMNGRYVYPMPTTWKRREAGGGTTNLIDGGGGAWEGRKRNWNVPLAIGKDLCGKMKKLAMKTESFRGACEVTKIYPSHAILWFSLSKNAKWQLIYSSTCFAVSAKDAFIRTTASGLLLGLRLEAGDARTWWYSSTY